MIPYSVRTDVFNLEGTIRKVNLREAEGRNDEEREEEKRKEKGGRRMEF